MQARLALHKTAAPAYEALHQLESFINSSELPRELLDLVRLRVSQINGCAFCVDMHAYDLKQAGETDERIWSVAAWREAPFYTEEERAALTLAEAATRLPGNPDGVSDEVWDTAATLFTEPQLAVLVTAIAAINAWNRINVTTRRPAGTYRPAG